MLVGSTAFTRAGSSSGAGSSNRVPAVRSVLRARVVLRRARTLRDQGGCVVVVIHDLNLASAYSDRVVMLHDGAIVADGSSAEVLTTERIGQVYRQRVLVTQHPTRDCPLVVATD